MARRARWLVLLAALASPVWAAPPRAGGELLVNTYTTGQQAFPGVAAQASGRFVVVWESYGQDGSDGGIFGQRFDAAGTPVGGEFPVNEYTTNRQSSAAVAIGPAGDFVVVWTSVGGQDGSDTGVFGRHFDAGGSALGGEFQVNQYTTLGQFDPSIGVDAAGSFVVVWASAGSGRGIRARRFDPALVGGTEFGVSAYTTLVQAAPSLAVNSDGTFVATWSSFNQDGSDWGVFGRRFDAGDNPLVGEFAVNTHTTLAQDRSQVAGLGGGAFAVVWQSNSQDGSGNGIFGQRYDSLGNPLDGEFAISTFTTNGQQTPDVAPDGAGGFVVVWDSQAQDGSLFGIFGRSFDASGAALDASDFLVNTLTAGNQRGQVIAAAGGGRFVVAWQSPPDGSGYGVRAQRYGDLIFADGFE